MRIFLNLIRYAGLMIFWISLILLLLTLLNFAMGFSQARWLEIYFARLYIFFMIVGILAYILVRFRRRKGE